MRSVSLKKVSLGKSKLFRVSWSDGSTEQHKPWWNVSNLLLENGANLLLENGGAILMEQKVEQLKVV